MNATPQVWAILGACAVAWASIAAAVAIGQRRVRMGVLRGFGALALASLALIVAGLPVPVLAPAVLLVVGVVVAVVPGSRP